MFHKKIEINSKLVISKLFQTAIFLFPFYIDDTQTELIKCWAASAQKHLYLNHQSHVWEWILIILANGSNEQHEVVP